MFLNDFKTLFSWEILYFTQGFEWSHDKNSSRQRRMYKNCKNNKQAHLGRAKYIMHNLTIFIGGKRTIEAAVMNKLKKGTRNICDFFILDNFLFFFSYFNVWKNHRINFILLKTWHVKLFPVCMFVWYVQYFMCCMLYCVSR